MTASARRAARAARGAFVAIPVVGPAIGRARVGAVRAAVGGSVRRKECLNKHCTPLSGSLLSMPRWLMPYGQPSEEIT